MDLSTEENSCCITEGEVEAAPAGAAAKIEKGEDQPKGMQQPAQNLADVHKL